MPNWKISYSERKDQCCPPSSYRQVNTVIVEAENETDAAAQLIGIEIELKQIKLAD
jgi:hypothetical protein|tara:strand:- start:413 stop:580 length:168 start_codon:yes stop_codon:yes gene_type:complete